MPGLNKPLRAWLQPVLLCCTGFAWPCAHAQAPDVGAILEKTQRPPFYLALTVEGNDICNEAADDPTVLSAESARQQCAAKRLDGSQRIADVLEALEPGGARGQVQVGYVATLHLLSLFRNAGAENAPPIWEIDEQRVQAYTRLITHIQRPVVLYLASNHFDTQGEITHFLMSDPRNLMQWADGQTPRLGYFGYPIAPYTLRTDETIPVNHYRFAALRRMAQAIAALPDEVQSRIIAITLAGEVHHLFPDFENGMGNFDAIQVTDYSERSQEDFRAWLQQQYASIEKFNADTGLDMHGFNSLHAPGRDLKKSPATEIAQHYDAFAAGEIAIGGWIWDPASTVQDIVLYVDGKQQGAFEKNMNRLDVYRALDDVTTPNTGFRLDFDYTRLENGPHQLQIVARTAQGDRLLGERPLFIHKPGGGHSLAPWLVPQQIPGIRPADALANVRYYIDIPARPVLAIYNPLARLWDSFRQAQVLGFLQKFHAVALEAGLPADKLYSHQIVPQANSSWNSRLFAVDKTLDPRLPWHTGINLYGGAVHGDWTRQFLASKGFKNHAAPEFNPQQWKTPDIHLQAMLAHYQAGATFIGPYYIDVVPARFKDKEHGVNAMEISPDNTRDGSHQFYEAIRRFAAY